jgi:hypothetical protein
MAPALLKFAPALPIPPLQRLRRCVFSRLCRLDTAPPASCRRRDFFAGVRTAQPIARKAPPDRLMTADRLKSAAPATDKQPTRRAFDPAHRVIAEARALQGPPLGQR